MRTVILGVALALSMFYTAGCGSVQGCPTCGTDKNGTVAIIDIIPVPEHNPTGEPGGPFNSFDTSWVDPVYHRFYVSDRIGLDVVVVDTIHDLALNAIGGANSVAEAGNNASACVATIPPLVSAHRQFHPLRMSERRTLSFRALGPTVSSGDFLGPSAAPPAPMASTLCRAPTEKR